MNIGIYSIQRERLRQMAVEGWTHEHDDQHNQGELEAAARCYHWAADLERHILSTDTPEEVIPPPQDWPWEKEWWKPARTPRRNYEKAGALYLAECDRLNRLPGVENADRSGACTQGADICAAHINAIASPFVRTFNRQQEMAFETNRAKGFESLEVSDGERLMMIVGEVAEADDALRHGNPKDDHIPEFLGTEAELADVVIRCMSLCERNNWRLAEAVEAKMAYNATREHRHGGKRR